MNDHCRFLAIGPTGPAMTGLLVGPCGQHLFTKSLPLSGSWASRVFFAERFLAHTSPFNHHVNMYPFYRHMEGVREREIERACVSGSLHVAPAETG